MNNYVSGALLRTLKTTMNSVYFSIWFIVFYSVYYQTGEQHQQRIQTLAEREVRSHGTTPRAAGARAAQHLCGGCRRAATRTPRQASVHFAARPHQRRPSPGGKSSGGGERCAQVPAGRPRPRPTAAAVHGMATAPDRCATGGAAPRWVWELNMQPAFAVPF